MWEWGRAGKKEDHVNLCESWKKQQIMQVMKTTGTMCFH